MMITTYLRRISVSIVVLLLAFSFTAPLASAITTNTSPCPISGYTRNSSGTCVMLDENDTNQGGTVNTSSSNKPATLVNLLKVGSLEELIKLVLGAVVQIGSILLVLCLIWTGFLFIQAQGKEEKIRDARAALMWTVLGGVLLLGAQTLWLIINATISTL